MKIFLPVLFLFIGSFSTHQSQKKFIELEGHSDQYEEWVNDSDYDAEMKEVFEHPEEKRLYLALEAFDSTAGYDFSKLKVESLAIHAGMQCDEPDSVRTAFASQIKQAMGKISCFSKCRHLKRVVFIIGNHVYLTQAQCRPRVWETMYGEHYNKRLNPKNLQAAWNLFGNNVQRQLPRIPLYAVSEYW